MVFGAHAMDHIPEEEMPAVADAAHAVCRDAIGGFTILDVPSHEEALSWAARIVDAAR
jgi:hypothetical protein